MAGQRRARSVRMDAVIGYEKIAEKMGVQVKSVRIYRARDADFPEPVTPPELRSPGFDEAEIDKYIEIRNIRAAGKSGRAPRTADAEPRLEADPEIGRRIRDLVAESAGSVTLSELAGLIGIKDSALGFRLRGQVRWKLSELEVVAKRLGTTADRLRGITAPAKPKRSSARKTSTTKVAE